MSASDVKVWDAPSIGRNDGMSVETKCYQHVVIWADYAKALMKVEDERDEANRVCEQWRQWTVNAREEIERLRADVEQLKADAERYRWLRDEDRCGVAVIAWRRPEACAYGQDQVDKAIDAAIRATSRATDSREGT